MHLEASPTRGNQLDLGVRVLAANLGRQTDGPWLVVSDLAVLDGDLHRQVWLALKLTRRERHADVRRESPDDRILARDDASQRIHLRDQQPIILLQL